MEYLCELASKLTLNEDDILILERDLQARKNKLKKYCIHKDCQISKRYNYANENEGIYCNNHKLKDMVNVVDKKCRFEGCCTIPNYNYPGEIGGKYCFSHKKEEMIDVKRKNICQHEECTTSAHFGYQGT